MQLGGFLFFISAIAVGFFTARFRVVSAEAERVLPELLINVCYPALILSSFSRLDARAFASGGLAVTLSTLAVTLGLYLAGALLFRRAAPERRPVLRFQMAIGNVTYVAIPLLSIFLGPGAVAVAVLHGSAQDVLIYSLYYALFAGFRPGEGKAGLRRALLNPCILALAAALLLKLTRLELPAQLLPAIDGLGGMTTPLALVYLGAMLHRHGFFRWLGNGAAVRYALYKTLLLPAGVALLLLPFAARQTAVLTGALFASPAPVASIVWARAYDCDAAYAVDAVVCSTLFYLVIMSAALFALTRLGVLTPSAGVS
ncbi:MAG: Membrane transport protein [Firmicutes bacterium ADurb.Bin248]|nr:MAG: Membrane transport protein [Firmicutes bacterium ADurb.Bin248]HOG00265.1 AEC family transporter [Clostridia bacterium]HPK16816.1 AEC family transporter [Clostridia bacterium]